MGEGPKGLAVASSLATVAIATLGGPIPAVAAGLGEVVKHAETLIRKNREATAVQRSVTQAIEWWAASERVADAGLGIDLAAQVIARHGASERERARLDYDPNELTELVWVRASSGAFPELITYEAEDRVVAARRAITITYDALNSQLGANEPLLPAIIELLTEIHTYADSLRRIEGKIDNLSKAQRRAAAPVIQLTADTVPREAVFVGRGHEEAQLLSRLDPQHSRSTTNVSVVAGLGGVGKTALAHHVAAAALERHWFTVVLVTDLRGYDPDQRNPVVPEELFSSMLRALGVAGEHVPSDPTDQATLYHQTLTSLAERNERSLLIFDNVASSGQLRNLLPASRVHQVLLTSRHTLGELANVYLLELDTLPENDAVDVLDKILRSRSSGDARVTEQAESATALVRECSCLPLALRIIGAILAEDLALPLSTLVEDLADADTRLEALEFGELAVSSVLDLSWARLLEVDKLAAQLFLELPVNPGLEISTDAAAALIRRSRLVTRSKLIVLKSMHLIEQGIHAGHWGMADIVHLYANKLAQARLSPDHRAGTTRRLLSYYLKEVDAANKQLIALAHMPASEPSPERKRAIDWLEAERPNLVASVLLAQEAGHSDVAVDLALSLSTFLRLRYYLDDYATTAIVAVRAAGALSDRRRETMAVTNLGLAPGDPRLDDLVDTLRRELLVARDSGNTTIEAWALGNLGSALWAMHRYIEVIDVASQASTKFAGLGDHHHEAWALTLLGLAYQRAGMAHEASDMHKRAREVFRGTADRNGEAWALTNLGAALRDLDRPDDAITVGEEARAIFRETGDRIGEGATDSNLGGALRVQRRFKDALATYQHALEVFREAGDRAREAATLTKMGMTLGDLGRLDAAVEVHQQAITLFQGIGDRYGEASALADFAQTQAKASLLSEAERDWRRALELFNQVAAIDDVERVHRLLDTVSNTTKRSKQTGT